MTCLGVRSPCQKGRKRPMLHSNVSGLDPPSLFEVGSRFGSSHFGSSHFGSSLYGPASYPSCRNISRQPIAMTYKSWQSRSNKGQPDPWHIHPTADPWQPSEINSNNGLLKLDSYGIDPGALHIAKHLMLLAKFRTGKLLLQLLQPCSTWWSNLLCRR